MPVGAIRGRYPGTTEPVLFIVNHPTPDSTALSAFVGGRLVRRLALPLASNVARFMSADVPSGREEEPPPARVFAVFQFDAPSAAASVLWNHNLDRWAAVVQYKADGSSALDGDTEWFGSEILDAQHPQGASEDVLSNRAQDRDTRQLVTSGSASLRVNRTEYTSYSGVSYQISVYNGDVGPMQRMEGIVSGS